MVEPVSIDELQTLPLRAIVAFAVRAARRAQPLYELPSTDERRDKFLLAVDESLSLSESWLMGIAAASPRARAVVSRAYEAAEEKSGYMFYATYSAVYAAATAADATAENDSKYAAMTAFGAAYSVDPYTSVPGLYDEADNAAKADFARLKQLLETDEAFAVRSLDATENGPLGPLWPGALPDQYLQKKIRMDADLARIRRVARSSDLRAAYDRRLPRFRRAAENIREAIELLLERSDVHPLVVLSRVKTFDSFAAKAESKAYPSPFDQNTDFVGVRVILYLPSEIALVADLLHRKFNVLESEDKATLLEANEFGYRSHHILIQIRDEWASTPNYEGLQHITVEVQIRTLLMHAWAEIEHKLNYKSKDQIPQPLQRKLFSLSAKVEEADKQFEELVADVRSYRQKIAEDAAAAGEFDTTLDMNLDTLRELVRFFYPGRECHEAMMQTVYEELIESNVSLPDIVNAARAFKKFEPHLDAEFECPLAAPACLSYAAEVLIEGFHRPEKGTKERNELIERMKVRVSA